MTKQFARYDSYKDSGVEWLGEVPNNWNIVPLFTITKFKSITNYPERELLSVYLDKGVIRFNDVTEKRTNVTSLDLSKYQAVDIGDFVLNNQQAWRGSVGVSTIQGIVSPAYIVLSLSSLINKPFGNYFFRNSMMVSNYLICSKGVGTIQRNLYWSQLKRALVCLPPIEEQERVADFLDKRTVQIDEVIAQKEKMIELLKEYRQVTINNAVTKGLDPNIPMKDSGVEWLGQIPTHWEVKKLKYFGNIYAGIANKSGSDFSKEIISKFKQFIPFTNICNNFVINNSDMQYVNIKDNENQNIVMNGDLLFLMSSETLDDIGKSAVYLSDEKVYLNSFCKGFRLKVKKNAKYVNYLLNSNSYRAYFSLCGRGFTRINIKQEYINDVPIIDIPTSEQQNIVKFLDKKTAQIDDAISLKHSEIEKLKEYKATLIDSAVTGKIKV